VDLDVPEEAARLSAGCGNPVDTASIQDGDIVLDLGSGAGIDVFKASTKVGPAGRIIGVDSTPEMIGKAREIAEKNGYQNVEFRLGEIEHMPVESNTVDVAISNCVLNLLPDKLPGFREIHRVLKPGGRLVISDLTTRHSGPQNLNDVDPSTWAACVAGAISREEYLQLLTQAGFQELSSRDAGASTGLISVTIIGVKPRSG
jgi:arsenite methyltransferase